MRLADAYEELGIPPDSSITEAKSAYKKLARQHHPDKSDDPDATAKMQQLTAAFSKIEKHHAGEPDDEDDDDFDGSYGVRDEEILSFLSALFSGAGFGGCRHGSFGSRVFFTMPGGGGFARSSGGFARSGDFGGGGFGGAFPFHGGFGGGGYYDDDDDGEFFDAADPEC